jgi:hypothetical protein
LSAIGYLLLALTNIIKIKTKIFVKFNFLKLAVQLPKAESQKPKAKG